MEYTTINSPIQSKALLTISAKEVADAIRQQLHFLFVLDTSGSMQNDHKLTNCIKSILHTLHYVNATDYVTFITFNSRAQVHIQGELATGALKERLIHVLNTLTASGGTNMYDALASINRCLYNLDNMESIKHCILLLTDGHPTSGDTHTDVLQEQVDEIICAFPSTSISTVGYGTDHNEYLLKYIAQEGSGSYSVVNSLLSVAGVFGYIMGSLISCVASSIHVTVSGSADSKARAVPMTAYKTRQKDKYTYDVSVGDMSEGQIIHILIDYSLPNYIRPLPLPELDEFMADEAGASSEVAEPVADTIGLLIKGIHTDGTEFEQTLTINTLHVNPDPESLIMVETVRYDVYTLLEQIAASEISNEEITLTKEKLLVDVGRLPQDNPLVVAMKDELKRISVYSREHISQNSMCIGLSRGMRMVGNTLDTTMATPIQREVSAAVQREASTTDPMSASTASAEQRVAPSVWAAPMDTASEEQRVAPSVSASSMDTASEEQPRSIKRLATKYSIVKDEADTK
jgi:Mg-chelatase subunit ChlD